MNSKAKRFIEMVQVQHPYVGKTFRYDDMVKGSTIAFTVKGYDGKNFDAIDTFGKRIKLKAHDVAQLVQAGKIQQVESFSEGLESMVDRILDDNEPELLSLYGWRNGLEPIEPTYGPMIAAAINKYGKHEIGHARWNPKTGRVVFAAFKQREDHPHRPERAYVDYDKDTNSWCVFGADSGHAYASYPDEDEASNKADEINKRFENEDYSEPGTFDDWRSPEPPIHVGGRVPPTPMVCQECGHKFKKRIGAGTVEVKCPKCGGYDTEVA